MRSRFFKPAAWFVVVMLIAACGPGARAAQPTPTHPAAVPTRTATAVATGIPPSITRAIPSATLTLEMIATMTETRAAVLPTTPSNSPTDSPARTSEPTLAPSATSVPPTETATLVPTRLSPTRLPPIQLPENVTRGIAVFAEMKCASCHVKPARGQRIAPDLDHIATEAEQIIRSPDYHGSAADVPSFLYESIVDPDAYVQPPFGNLTVDGLSLMPKDFGQKLNAQQLQDLVAYLLTRR